ncbi:G-protein coupled receptor 183-like [Anneissia japonica]|uniref:G-protein coupled receptor 183-like n=1 Tax=Anneissia japonica TaxID=1529436 RepID=UPI00142568A4|nr:G-protein coupled receptor 183-like [Anneissia japonica]
MDNMTTPVATSVPDLEDSVTLIIARWLVSIVGVVVNLLVMFVFIYNKTYKKSLSHALLLHQTMIDMLGCCMFLVFYNYDAPEGTKGNVFCKSRFLYWYMSATSSYNLVMITIERYVAVVHPVMYRQKSVSRKKIATLIVPHLFGFLSSCTVMVIAKVNPESKGECKYFYSSNTTALLSAFFIFSMYWMIPVIVLVYCYARILLSLRKMAKIQNSNNESRSSNNRQLKKPQRSMILTLVLVAIAFLVTVTPNFTLYIVYNICRCFEFSSVLLHEVTVLLNVGNLCINPFIYCFTFTEFKRGIRKIRNDILGRPTQAQDDNTQTFTQTVS